ncbi:MAG: NADH-quinone oxidoreductase subunit NuoG [Bryobacterales bacterium]|nr:NADH-quinone oxidoreductase subunit NuoG [Bryobacterales bacterium]
MATVYIENRAYDADPGENLLKTCLGLGFDLPYFCWHPAMGSIGACRQCAVKQFKDENDTKGRLVMACMTPSSDGARISIADPEAAEFRAGIIEGLMLNHPHDCPVCDEGGECHLQDMTLMTGHSYRRYRFHKRTFRNQYLGPFLAHEMNRCIQCYRCVRFYRGYAGGRDFNSFSIRNTVYFGRHEDGVLENEFSGNLAEVCPTGVFVDRTLAQHYTRKWDQQFAPSICAACGVGCNISPAERYGMLRRIVNRYHPEINGHFLCDRGRYSYEFVNSEKRIRQARMQSGAESLPLSKDEALSRLAEILRHSRGVAGIGSPRASLEANFALRLLSGPDRFFAGINENDLALARLMIELNRTVRAPSLREIESCDAVLVLGEDVTQTNPRIALALRQSVEQQPRSRAAAARIPLWNDLAVREIAQDQKGPLFVAALNATRLDDVAAATYRAAPADIARLGLAVAASLRQEFAFPADLAPKVSELASRIADALLGAARPLVVSGPGCRSEAVIRAAAAVAGALAGRGKPAPLAFTMPEANTAGLSLMATAGLETALEALRSGGAETLVILENDLYRRAESSLVDDLLGKARHVVAVDHLENRTAARASLVLPAATFAESDGTFVNFEGRAQRFFQVFAPDGGIQESWRWLRDCLRAAGREEGETWHSLDHVIAAQGRQMPELAPAAQAAPPASFRIVDERVPRMPHRSSGRTAVLANVTMHEPKPPEDPDSPLAFSMEGYPLTPPQALRPFTWLPGWNSVQALNRLRNEAGAAPPGPSGVRLYEARNGLAPAASNWPEAFRPREGEWLLLPLHHIFGSEELSMYGPAIASLAPRPYVAVRDGFEEGQMVEVSVRGLIFRLPARIMAALPAGTAGLPSGLPGMDYVRLPDWGRITEAAG